MNELYLKKIYSLEEKHLKNVKKTKNKDYFYPNLKTNYEKVQYEKTIIIPSYKEFFTYINNNSLFFTNDTIKTLTTLFRRIIYYEENNEKDYKFIYKEYLNIVDNCTSYLYENILNSLKCILKNNETTSLEPFIKELENTSNHFNNHYLNDRIKILVYKFTVELQEYLSQEELNRLENLLLKTCTTKETPNELKSYKSSLANYLYCINIDDSKYLEHTKIIYDEGSKDIISTFNKDIIENKLVRKRKKEE